MLRVTHSLIGFIVMSITGWTVLLGSVGAAIARSNGDRGLKGFAISALLPLPFISWYLTWVLTKSDL